ncbi:MAG: hypothetical protein RLY14_3247, partial [Planctomycetota bacterium]
RCAEHEHRCAEHEHRCAEHEHRCAEHEHETGNSLDEDYLGIKALDRGAIHDNGKPSSACYTPARTQRTISAAVIRKCSYSLPAGADAPKLDIPTK